jgi:hypothetical protein
MLAGSRVRKASKSSGSNFLVGANCHEMGPSFDPSSLRPLVTKRSMAGRASPSRPRLVA